MEGRKLTGRKLVALVRRGERAFRHVVVSEPDLAGVELDGVDLWGARLPEARLRGAHLSGVALPKAELTGADLTGAELRRTNLWGSQLGGAQLGGARLIEVNLEGAELSRADLSESRLVGTSLAKARLAGASLVGASLRRVDLEEAVLDGADLTDATLVDVALPAALGDATLHGATFDWRTIARSLHHPALSDLLERAGMPKLAATYLVDALHAIDAVQLSTMVQSVFLAHGPEAANVALSLRRDLSEQGVKTWHRAGPQLGTFDRMILCCTRPLLVQGAVLDVVEATLAREAEGGPHVLLPVVLDDVLDDPAAPPAGWPADRTPLYRVLRKRIVADLRGAAAGSEGWWAAIETLMGALR